MARSVRTISVNLNAGTATFFRDLDAASGKLREFGQHGVSDVQATSAALRVMEGNMTNNLRAAERFVAQVLGAGPLLKLAFPIVGAVALGGVLSELGTKAYDFYKSIRDADEKAQGAFRGMAAPLRLVNDELAVSNDRLTNEIAKLEGRHENTLKLALDEARVAADKLADSLDKDLANIHKVLQEQEGGVAAKAFRFFAGDSSTTYIAKWLGGETGEGGFRAEQSKLALNTPPADFPEKQAALLKKGIAQIDRYVHDAQERAKPLQGFNVYGGEEQIPGQNVTREMEELNALRNQLQGELQRNQLQTTNTGLTQRHDKDQADRDNARQDKPFEDRMKKIGAEIEALRAKLAAVGEDPVGQTMARAFGDAQKAIEEVNKELKHLDGARKNRIAAAEETKAMVEAEATWTEKYDASTRAIDERIQATNSLTDAIGKGYAATREANVQARIMQEMGARANLPQYAGEAAGLRQRIETEFDAGHAQAMAQSVDKLNDQIELERVLAAVQKQGVEVVREATFAMKLRQLAAENASHAQIQTEIELFNAQRQNTDSASIAKIDEKIQATQRTTAAILQSRAAERQATIDNQVAEAARAGASGARQDAIRQEGAGQYAQELARLAVETDRTRALDDQIQKLQDAKTLFGDTLAIEIQLRALENQRIESLAQESLGLRGVRDGVRAFFIEMQTDAKSAAQIVYDSLNSALDRVSANVAKVFTGQKTDWAKSFQQLGTEMTQESVKSLLHEGLGRLGKVFGVDVGQGKPDGSASNPLWVRMAGAGEHIGSLDHGIGGLGRVPGISGIPTGVFQGSAGGWAMSLLRALHHGGGEGIGSLDQGIGMDNGSLASLASLPFFGGMRAGGGDVEPGKVYWTGEQGPEPFIPSAPGKILPHGSMGGDTHIHYTVNAPGSDLGAHNRIARMIEASNHAAVSAAVQTMHERSKRVPGGGR